MYRGPWFLGKQGHRVVCAYLNVNYYLRNVVRVVYALIIDTSRTITSHRHICAISLFFLLSAHSIRAPIDHPVAR